ncbi:MAG: SGNH/GDSL hydrolase family protein, partial [Acidobacteriota bacterium]
MKRNLLLGASVTALFLCLLEGGLRLSGRVATDTLRSPDLETLERIPGVFEPNKQFVDRIRPELAYRVKINSLGFRGREIDAGKRPGSVRIICLGDSYTFGHYVDDDEAFPAVLERLLRARRRATEVINAGVNGFSIVDELALFREKVLALDPDIVVLVFSQNDILDLARPRPMIELMRDHARLKSVFILGPTLKVLQHTALFNAMQRVAAGLRGGRRDAVAATLQDRASELWNAYHARLAQFAALARTRDIRVLLVAWPSARQVAGDAVLTPNRRLERFAGELGIAFLDLTDPLRSLLRRGVEPTLAPRDGHPSPAGHEGA